MSSCKGPVRALHLLRVPRVTIDILELGEDTRGPGRGEMSSEAFCCLVSVALGWTPPSPSGRRCLQIQTCASAGMRCVLQHTASADAWWQV